MSDDVTTELDTPPWRPSRWHRLRRPKLLTAAVGLVLIAVVLGVTDPFNGSGSSPTSASSADPTSLKTITEGTLSSQTEVDATLGYTGSYTISIPSGTTASVLAQARATAQAAAQKVDVDEDALAQAKKVGDNESTATLATAQAAVTSDATALSKAKEQLTQDKRLGCPAASSSTVTTALSGGGSGSSTPSNSSSTPSSGSGPSGAGSGPSSSPSSSGGSNGEQSNATSGSGSDPSVPTATTGSASGTTAVATTLSGTVDPNGADTSYHFKYGTTAAFGSTTRAGNAGSGTTAISVSANLSDLRPGTTYDFALVTTNSAGTIVGATQSFQTAQSSCVAQAAVIAADEAVVKAAKATLAGDQANGNASVTEDEQQLATDQATLSTDNAALSLAESAQATDPGSVITGLPALGAVVHRGQEVYEVAGHAVPLFYGPVTPWRALYPGVSPGRDVTELNANLSALGFEKGGVPSSTFSAATEAALKAWESSISAPANGVLALGDVVVEPGPIVVDAVSASVGQAVQPGEQVLQATSTNRNVTVDLDASQQTDVKVGDQVTITLPDNDTTPGVVTSVGNVAVCPSGSSSSGSSSSGSQSGCTSQSGSSSTPTITVEVRLVHPADAGNLDQAPVELAITTASVRKALIIPVDALLSKPGGGYALEVKTAKGQHLVGVSLGSFDDADGLVQVSGSGIRAGEQVVVPDL